MLIERRKTVRLDGNVGLDGGVVCIPAELKKSASIGQAGPVWFGGSLQFNIDPGLVDGSPGVMVYDSEKINHGCGLG
jgi:hypothetical protein